MMGEDIERGFTINDLLAENQANLTLEEINEGPRLKDDVAFALLSTISLHTIAMLNEIHNFPKLDGILNAKPIGLRNCVS
jgi:hypothetical protein